MNAPGLRGYALAIVISLAAYAFFPLMYALPTRDGGGFDADGFVLVAVCILTLGTPVGVVGATIVHLTCRHEPRQWVHVLAAGASAVLIQVALVLLTGGDVLDLLNPLAVFLLGPMTLAAMVGRAAVIPLAVARSVHRPDSSASVHTHPA